MEKKPIRLGGRKPKAEAYPYKVTPEEAYLTQFIWDHRYVARSQALQFFFASKTTGPKLLARLVRKQWLKKERRDMRAPSSGRSVLSRVQQYSPELSVHFTGRAEILSIGKVGLEILKAQGFVPPYIHYDEDKQSLLQTHHVGTVQVWSYFETACKLHENDGHVMYWFGPARTLQLVNDARRPIAKQDRRDVRPDAFFIYQISTEDRTNLVGTFFVEMDMGTEFQTNLRRKLDAYEAWEREKYQGYYTWELVPPMKYFPYVLLIALDNQRRQQIAYYVQRMGKTKVRYLITQLSDLATKDPLHDPIFWEANPPFQEQPRQWRLVDLMTNSTVV